MCFHIHDETFIPVIFYDLLIDIRESGEACPSSVGDHDVETAHGFECLTDEVLYSGFGGYVGLEHMEPW